ncbi:MAG: glutaredoxin 3 [Candidatus Gastranaerophilales bacterium]|nr:glutaredoxin 3 [Candidatus Gastranaerophilales bacterium]
MKKVKIYTTSTCPYCIKAKKLLEYKKIPYEEISLNENYEANMATLSQKTGFETVPQIFIDEEFIGGCDDLYELEQHKKLDMLLGS